MPEANAPEQSITPKSLLRHRPISMSEPDTTGKEHTAASSPIIQRSSRLSKETVDVKAPTTKRITATITGKPVSPTSAPRHRHSHTYSTSLQQPGRIRKGNAQLSKLHPLLLLGLGMILMLLSWMLLSTVLNWANRELDTLRYGNPPTYQVDTYVGHNEHPGQPSHFIVVNLHRRIEIIEIAGSDPSHTRIYPGPQLYGTYDDLTPATLTFVTPAGKKYPDMILHVGDSQLTYQNNGQTFVSPVVSGA